MKGTLKILPSGGRFKRYLEFLRNVYKDCIPSSTGVDITYSLTLAEVRKALYGTTIQLLTNDPERVEVVFRGGYPWDRGHRCSGIEVACHYKSP